MDCYLIAYDIPGDKRRNKVANLLENYGQRVQLSVYEIWVDAGELRGLIRDLNLNLRPEEDSLRIYRLCKACQKAVAVLGQGETPQPPGVVII